MHGSTIAIVWLLQSATPHGAFGMVRPPECSIVEGFRTANAWERAKEPNLRRYCDLLASGTAKLVGPGSRVLVNEVPQIADEADRLLPGRAAPAILKGRAYLRLDRAEEAVVALREAKRRDDRALDDPIALLSWARANARTGRRAEAAKAYRAALPRTSALTAQERASACFEAGMAVMTGGAAEIEDAVAMFRQARRDAQDAMQVASTVALALALDRAGLRDEARSVLAERGRLDAKVLRTDLRVGEALADAGVLPERDALIAVALEPDAAARESWRAYLDGPGGKGPWADHAREGASGRASPPSRGGHK